jgi:hypothetical protein
LAAFFGRFWRVLREVRGKFLAGGQNEKAKIDFDLDMPCSVVVLALAGPGSDGLFLG